MILRKHHRVVVQGITGRQGRFWTERMQEYGTCVVAGVSPKHAGEQCCGLPVFETVVKVSEALGPVDACVMFVPPAGALAAAQDAACAHTKLLIILTEHIPAHDVMRIHAAAKQSGMHIIGPNTAGVVTPGESFAVIMPAFNTRVFKPGSVGVISRSGSLGTLVCLDLVSSGFGQSAFLGIGGDPMLGTTTSDALKLLTADERTKAIVVVGEIGGSMEEEAAALIRDSEKPVVSFLTGRASPPGKKMGHAGAIVTGTSGSYKSKRTALEAAGAVVVDTPAQLGDALKYTLRRKQPGRARAVPGAAQPAT